MIFRSNFILKLGQEKATDGWPDERLQKFLELLRQARPKELDSASDIPTEDTLTRPSYESLNSCRAGAAVGRIAA